MIWHFCHAFISRLLYEISYPNKPHGWLVVFSLFTSYTTTEGLPAIKIPLTGRVKHYPCDVHRVCLSVLTLISNHSLSWRMQHVDKVIYSIAAVCISLLMALH